MPLQGFLRIGIELKAPAEKLYNIFKSQAHQIPNINSSGNIQGVQLHQGDWGKNGSVKIWNYTIGEEVGIFKEKVELDDEDNAVTQNGLDGEMFKYCKSFKCIYQFAQMDEVSVATLSIHYEKLNEDTAPPDRYLDLMVNLVKDLDAHFAKG